MSRYSCTECGFDAADYAAVHDHVLDEHIDLPSWIDDAHDYAGD